MLERDNVQGAGRYCKINHRQGDHNNEPLTVHYLDYYTATHKINSCKIFIKKKDLIDLKIIFRTSSIAPVNQRQ